MTTKKNVSLTTVQSINWAPIAAMFVGVSLTTTVPRRITIDHKDSVNYLVVEYDEWDDRWQVRLGDVYEMCGHEFTADEAMAQG